MSKVPLKHTTYLPLEKVFYDFSTKSLLDRMLGEGDIAQTQYNTCLRETQPFFKESLEYVLTNMDMSESLWSHACWVDFFYRGNSSWSDIEYFVDSFSSILQFDKQEMNLLYENLIFKLCLRKTFQMEH